MFDAASASISKPPSPGLGGARRLRARAARATRPLALLCACAAALGSTPAGAAAGTPSDPITAHDAADTRASHHLFAPTPRDRMRELSPDRPDTTESPVTVDAGHFQLELEAGSLGRDQGSTELTMGVLNAKAGLTPRADLQVLVDGLHHQGSHDSLGDITLRMKLNVWGNDGGTSALAVMPFVNWPRGAPDEKQVEAGLIVPLELRLPSEWSLGTMLEVDAVDRPEGHGIDALVSATLGHALWGELDGYAELEATVAVDESEPAEVAANSGLVLAVTDDLSVDTGVRVGLSDAADDFVAFVGGTARY
jgi:outer membrane putative beta-barrel porin/alpha-amylase